MAKPRKKATTPDPPPMPQVGDKVTMPPSESIREITHVSRDGEEVNLGAPGTNLEWFRVRTEKLNFIDRKPPPQTSNPFTKAAITALETLTVEQHVCWKKTVERIEKLLSEE